MTTFSTYTAVVVDFRLGQGEVEWEQLEMLPNWTPIVVINGTADKPVFELTTIGDLFLGNYPTCVGCGVLIHPKNAVYLNDAPFCTECAQKEVDKFAAELNRVRESLEAAEKKLRKELEEMEEETYILLNNNKNEDIPF